MISLINFIKDIFQNSKILILVNNQRLLNDFIYPH